MKEPTLKLKSYKVLHLGRLQPYSLYIRLTCKRSIVKNKLAYNTAVLIIGAKSFKNRDLAPMF